MDEDDVALELEAGDARLERREISKSDSGRHLLASIAGGAGAGAAARDVVRDVVEEVTMRAAIAIARATRVVCVAPNHLSVSECAA
jgi:hypothetical protein